MPFLAVLVMPGGVAVEERAAPAVLPGQPHRITFGEQRGIGKVFRHPPIQRQFAARHRNAIFDNFLHARMQRKILRHGG